MSFATLYANLIVIFNYLKSDLIKKQRAFKIGLISIYLVVFFITMLMNVISVSPTIFIRLSEDQVGEADFIFVPMLTNVDVSTAVNQSAFDKLILKNNKTSSFFDVKFIDFDDLNERLKNVSFLNGLAPRWILKGNTTNEIDNQTNWAVSNLFIIDSKLENKQGMGRKLHLHTIGYNECYVSNSLYKSLKIDTETNNNVTIDVKLSAILKAFGKSDVTSMMEQYKVGFNDKEQGDEAIIDTKKKDGDEEENVKKDNHSLFDSDDESDDGSRIRKYIEELNITKITVSKEQILSLMQLKEIPKNFNISLSLLDSPLAGNLPFVKMFKSMLYTDNSMFGDFIEVDKENNVIKLKELKDYYDININLTKIINNFTDAELDDIASFKLDLKVKEVVPQTSGKWPSASGNVVAIDSNYMKQYFETNLVRILELIMEKYHSPFLVDLIETFARNVLKDFKINKYALTVNGIIKDKFEAYKLTQSNLRRYMSKKTDMIMNEIGYEYPLTITMPIYTTMQSIEIAKVFLENIFTGIMVFLWLLSVLLIYSLMLGNVDERTYEFGMLRSLGFKKDNLTVMIIIQGFIFAIPGVILGLISSYIANNYISFLLNWYTGIVMPYFLSGKTIMWGSIIGISIPLISSYFPIKKALDANLKETLTIFNKKIGDLVVSMVKLENLGISISSLLASLVIIVIGFATYYIAPLSFLLMDPGIFVFIMTMILIIMLIGLIIIIQLFIPQIQNFVLSAIMLFAWKDKNIYFIVRKNLEGHQRRNQKVSIMFMIALGFIIFSGCTLNLVVDFVKTLAKSAMGGDCAFWVGNQATLNEILLKDYLTNTIDKFPNLIYNYSFISNPVGYIIDRDTSISALNGYPTKERSIMAVDRNLVQSGFSDLYIASDYDSNLNYSYIPRTRKVDLVSMLYENPNIGRIIKNSSEVNFPINPNLTKYQLDMQLNVIAAEGIRKTMAIGPDNPCSAGFSTRYNQRIPCKVVGLASKLPGFPTFSSYSTLAYMSPVLISMDQMGELLKKEMTMYPDIKEYIEKSKASKNTPDGISKQGLLVKFHSDANPTLRDMVYYEIKNIIEEDGANSFLIDDVIETANTIGDIMGYIFLVLGIIALILSFFLIWTSFYSNIKENICEYGIMRSIGVTKNQSTRLYMYEAGSIIVSSIITGTFIGVVISVTLILQFNVFVELPFTFNFPYKLYFTLVSFGLFMGMLGSYYPIYEVNAMSLVKIMKGLSE